MQTRYKKRTGNVPRVDTAQIPPTDTRALCSSFLSAVQRFYENPDNQTRFNEWKKTNETKKEKKK